MKEKNYIFISILTTYFILIIGIIIYLSFLNKYISIPACPIYTHFGLYCPACGGTRAVISLFHFDIIQSIKYNPIVIYFFFSTTLYIIIETINYIFKKKLHFSWKICLWLGITILLINCIIKNIYILYFSLSV